MTFIIFQTQENIMADNNDKKDFGTGGTDMQASLKDAFKLPLNVSASTFTLHITDGPSIQETVSKVRRELDPIVPGFKNLHKSDADYSRAPVSVEQLQAAYDKLSEILPEFKDVIDNQSLTASNFADEHLKQLAVKLDKMAPYLDASIGSFFGKGQGKTIAQVAGSIQEMRNDSINNNHEFGHTPKNK